MTRSYTLCLVDHSVVVFVMACLKPLQFTAKQLLCAILTLAILLGLVSPVIRRARHQCEAVSLFERERATVHYKSAWLGRALEEPLAQLRRWGLRDIVDTVDALEFPSGRVSLKSARAARRLHGLEDLWLDDTLLSSEIICEISLNPHLRHLGLSYTNISDRDLMAVSRITELSWLRIDSTRVTDLGIFYLQPLQKLEVLTADDCPITDAAVKAIDHLESLEVLHIRRTSVSRTAKRWLADRHPNLAIFDSVGVVRFSSRDRSRRKAGQAGGHVKGERTISN